MNILNPETFLISLEEATLSMGRYVEPKPYQNAELHIAFHEYLASMRESVKLCSEEARTPEWYEHIAHHKLDLLEV